MFWGFFVRKRAKLELLEHVNLLSGVLVSCVLVYASMSKVAVVTCMYMCLYDHAQYIDCLYLCLSCKMLTCAGFDDTFSSKDIKNYAFTY